MHELAKVTLENEMDLIEAHRRSMKLAELVGLSLSQQTTFATAVSEISRTSIEGGRNGQLSLQVQNKLRKTYIVASLASIKSLHSISEEGLEYARRLVDSINSYSTLTENVTELFYALPSFVKVDALKIDEWRITLRNEPAISPYDQIKKKNEQLQELSVRLQKSETQYKTLTDSLPMVIFSQDVSGRIIYANQWLTSLTGFSAPEINEQNWKQVIHEEDYETFVALIKTSNLQQGTQLNMQCRIFNKTADAFFWHQVSLSAFNDSEGSLQFWIGYIVDVHAQKVFQETLRENVALTDAERRSKENQATLESYIKELNRSNEELQQFAFAASHDLQEPVRKILFYSDYLSSKYAGKIEGKGDWYLKSLQTAGLRMRNLINDLLLFSQIKSEKIAFQEVDLNIIANDAIQDLEMLISEKQAKVNVPELPRIKANGSMMRQVFGNLIGNSLKYSKTMVPPEIEISVSILPDYTELSFKDNGIGFDDKYLPKMFTLFQRLHTKDQYEGTGLGLAICKKIIEVHKGQIWAQSTEGEGATFFISIPN